MAPELFDIDSVDSLVRQVWAQRKTISLDQFEMPTYEIPDSYTIKEFNFSSEDNIYRKEIKCALDDIANKSMAAGYPISVFTALYEAVLNAHQHGNKKDSAKKVVIAYKIDNETVEVGVIDEVGELTPEFFPFVQRHREGLEPVLDFYKFSGREAQGPNLGTGTSFMHMYADNVQYFKSSESGLVAHLTFQREKDLSGNQSKNIN